MGFNGEFSQKGETSFEGRLMDRQTERQIYRWTDRQIDKKQIDRQVDEQLDSWTDKGNGQTQCS